MITAIIESVTEANGKYGLEKISAVTMSDGTQTKVYTKPAAKTIYEALKAGLQVQLTAKSGGTGYLIASIIGEAPDNTTDHSHPNGQPHSPSRREPDKKAQAEYIKIKAGQLKYAYDCLTDSFGNILVTEETLRSFAATIIISLDRHGPQ